MGEERTIEGKILKGIGGFYYVLDDQGKVHECKARGRFRNEKITPLPGDDVTFMPEVGESHGYIEEIHERKNQLTRPQVTNIDQVMITIAASAPKPDLMLVDKLIISAFMANIHPIIIINKSDLATKAEIKALENQYKPHFDVVVTSVKKRKGLSKILQMLTKKTTCFAGQSAVGKSSILNALFKELGLETGELSKKTARGKHTTRHAELIKPQKVEGTVVDTPGFSLLNTANIDKAKVGYYYPEMKDILHLCKFSSCLHTHEPDCAVKKAVQDGDLHEGRYNRYKKIIEEIEKGRRI